MKKPINLGSIFKKYQKKWIALTDNDKVIAYGTTLKSVVAKARKRGYEDPIVMKVPDPRYSLVL